MNSRPLTVVLGRDVQADDLLVVHTDRMAYPVFVQVVTVFGTGHGRVQLEVRPLGSSVGQETVWLDAEQQVVVIR